LKRPSSSVKQLKRALLDRTAFVGDVVRDTNYGKVIVTDQLIYKIYCPCDLREPIYAALSSSEFLKVGDYPLCDCGNALKMTLIGIESDDDIEEFPEDQEVWITINE